MDAFGIIRSFQSWYGASIMGLLALFSIYLVALILVRFKFFREIAVDSQVLLNEVQQALAKKDIKKLTEFKTTKRANDPPLRVLVSVGLNNEHLSEPKLSDLLWSARIRQRMRLSRGLSQFGTLAAISPFMGLLGTVLGIVQSFNDLAMSGAAGPNVVASGVASALWTTAAGLVVAIPAVIAFNVFNYKAKMAVTDLEVMSRELIVVLKEGRISQ